MHIDGPKNKEEWLPLGCAGEYTLHFAAGVLDDFIVPLLAFLLVRGRANIETVALIGNLTKVFHGRSRAALSERKGFPRPLHKVAGVTQKITTLWQSLHWIIVSIPVTPLCIKESVRATFPEVTTRSERGATWCTRRNRDKSVFKHHAFPTDSINVGCRDHIV